MINKIKTNNFKSLIDFELEIKPGINILVGPNGSGKTNIITFFEFVASIVSGNLWKAISELGGAGAIFTKGKEGYEKLLKAEIVGCCNSTQENKFLYYKYLFSLDNNDSAAIHYINQRLMIKSLKQFNNDDAKASGYDWDLDMIQSYDGKNNSIEIKKVNWKGMQSMFYLGDEKNNKGLDMGKINEFLSSNSDRYTGLLHVARFAFQDASTVMGDINGGKVYNIIPSKVKSPEDAATPFGISKDGSGVAATLYGIKFGRNHVGHFRPWESKEKLKTSLSRIIELTKTANPSVETIDVFNDPYDNKLRINIGLNCGDHSTLLPLSVLSDGTVKWLSLVTALETSSSIFSIEEPENYLHPKIQSEVIDVIRGIQESKIEKISLIMTTHSETILNSIRPNEIIIVRFKSGRTEITRPSEIDSISQQIQETGFGLGYFYNAGALDD